MALGEKLGEKLSKKVSRFGTKLQKKAEEAENRNEAAIDSGEWMILFMASVFVDLLFVILAIVGLTPVVGQAIYAIVDPILNFITMGTLWIYLQYKGLGGYWWLAAGSGLINLVPVLDWVGWTLAITILYFLVKAEKIPLAGEAIQKGIKAASKIK